MTTLDLAGHTVKRMGYGAMQLAGPGVFGPMADPEAGVEVLRRAVQLGVNHIDTSEFYGPHVVNQLIRRALHPYSDDLALVSKIGFRRDEAGNWNPFQTPEQLIADAQENLDTLGVSSMAAINLRLAQPEENGEDAIVPLDEQLDAMNRLVDAGLIDGFGVSYAKPEQAKAAIEAGAVCVQNAFNVLMRDDLPTLRLCEENNVAYVPFFPLGSAFPDIPKVRESERVQAVAQRLGATPSQVGLAWLLAFSPSILLIPGTSSVAHLEENLAAVDLTLSDDDLAELA